MSNQITTTSASNPILEKIKNDPLYPVVEAYLDTVKTSKGHTPSQDIRDNFILTCVTYKLNPVKKQIYLLGYDSDKNGPTFNEIVAASGFTAIASRTGEFAGLDQPRFTYNENNLDSCSVTVYRMIQGQRCAFTGNAYFEERSKDKFGVKKQFREQPKTMLEKCARAAALRIAFPEELGNKYDIDEMPRETTEQPVKSEPQFATEAQVKKLLKQVFPGLARLQNTTEESLQQKICDTFKVSGITELTLAQAQKTINEGLKKIEELEQAQSEQADVEAEANQ